MRVAEGGQLFSSSSGDTASGDLVTEAEWADIIGQLGGDSVHTAAGLLEVEDAGASDSSDSNHPSVAATELTWGATEPWREEWSTPAAAHSVTVDSINSEELMVGEPAQVDSLQIDADTGEVGRCEVRVAATEGCQRSEEHGYWHVARDRGVMRIQIHCSDVPVARGEWLVRAVLFRRSELHKHHPVSRVCAHHAAAGAGRVLEGVAGAGVRYSAPAQGPRPSAVFPCPPPDAARTITANIALRFRCNASCVTSDSADVQSESAAKAKDAAQDLQLVLTVEAAEAGRGEAGARVVARRSLAVWPKETVNKRDLRKPERMRPKGGQATRRKRLLPQTAALEEMGARVVAEMETRNINKNDLFDTVDRILSKRAKK